MPSRKLHTCAWACLLIPRLQHACPHVPRLLVIRFTDTREMALRVLTHVAALTVHTVEICSRAQRSTWPFAISIGTPRRDRPLASKKSSRRRSASNPCSAKSPLPALRHALMRPTAVTRVC